MSLILESERLKSEHFRLVPKPSLQIFLGVSGLFEYLMLAVGRQEAAPNPLCTWTADSFGMSIISVPWRSPGDQGELTNRPMFLHCSTLMLSCGLVGVEEIRFW